MIKEIRIPEISENVTSGKVVTVLVKVGDMIDVDDILMEFETEKALVEIPSTVKGKIVELLAKENDEMHVGDVIAKVETEAGDEQATEEEAQEKEASQESAKKEGGPSAEEKKGEEEEDKARQRGKEEEEGAVREKGSTQVEALASREEKAQTPSGGKEIPKAQKPAAEERPPAPAAPSVRRFARELGIDIHHVKGTGPGGRITDDDVKAAARQGRAAAEQTSAEAPLPDFSRWGEVEATELSAVRRLTAQSTAVSWRMVPHVTQFDRADITHVNDFIRKNGPRMQKRGVKLTITAVVMKICAVALLKFPRFNTAIDSDNNRLIHKHYVHIGLAVDTQRGLLVPVVRDADRKTIFELADGIADLAERARNKKIKPDEMEGGTFTISNQGGIGGTQFTPIVMWPQAAILGLSRASVEPVFIDGGFEPRSVLPLALSYDHRIIDGADAARFLRWVCESLEQPLTLHLE